MVWLVLREALIVVALGLVIGLPAVFGAATLATDLVFKMKPADPVSIILAMTLMLAVTATASYIPARRASRADPIAALRHE